MEKRKPDLTNTKKDKSELTPTKKLKTDYNKMDNPDMLVTEKESIFDMHEDMQTVDSIPVEELNDQVKDEKEGNKAHTKSTSSSERKYKP